MLLSYPTSGTENSPIAKIVLYSFFQKKAGRLFICHQHVVVSPNQPSAHRCMLGFTTGHTTRTFLVPQLSRIKPDRSRIDRFVRNPAVTIDKATQDISYRAFAAELGHFCCRQMPRFHMNRLLRQRSHGKASDGCFLRSLKNTRDRWIAFERFFCATKAQDCRDRHDGSKSICRS